MIEYMHNGNSFLARDDNYSGQWMGQGKTKTLAREDFYATVVKYDLRPIKVQLHGRTYTVTITEDGFAYNGMTYSSLTKVAQIITGAHWSGPRFFGLNGRTGNCGNVDDNGECDG